MPIFQVGFHSAYLKLIKTNNMNEFELSAVLYYADFLSM